MDLDQLLRSAQHGELISVSCQLQEDQPVQEILLDSHLEPSTGELVWEPLLNNTGDALADSADNLAAHLRTKRYV